MATIGIETGRWERESEELDEEDGIDEQSGAPHLEVRHRHLLSRAWYVWMLMSIAMATGGVALVTHLTLLKSYEDLAALSASMTFFLLMDYAAPFAFWGVGRMRLIPGSPYKNVTLFLAATTVIRVAGVLAAWGMRCHPDWATDGCDVLPVFTFFNGFIFITLVLAGLVHVCRIVCQHG